MSTIVSLPLQVGTRGRGTISGLRNLTSSTTNGFRYAVLPLPPPRPTLTRPAHAKSRPRMVKWPKSKLIIVGTDVGTANEIHSKAWGSQLGVQEPPFFFSPNSLRPRAGPWQPGSFDDGKTARVSSGSEWRADRHARTVFGFISFQRKLDRPVGKSSRRSAFVWLFVLDPWGPVGVVSIRLVNIFDPVFLMSSHPGGCLGCCSA